MAAGLRTRLPLLVAILFVVLFVANGLSTATTKQWVSIIQSGLYLASIFFLVASGFSLIFGLMDVLNLAHGTLLMFGAYIGYTMFGNPRLFTNTFPLFGALLAGMLLGLAAAQVRSRVSGKQWVRSGIALALGALATSLTVAAVRNFPLERLVAFAITATGGAVSTAEAQEPLGAMFRRMALLAGAGTLFGLLFAARSAASRRSSKHVAGAAVLVLLASAAMLLARDGIETFLLGTDVDVRFLIALIAGTAGGALLGGLVEWGLIRPLYTRPIYQILLTLGLVFVGAEIVKFVWGPAAYPPMARPSLFAESCTSASFPAWLGEHCAAVKVFGRNVPTYRIFVMAVALTTFVAVLLLLKKSRLGMIIRAGVQDADMVQALGINVRSVFTLVFALGSGLAALGGVVLAPAEGLHPGMGFDLLIAAVIAVVIGGLGSFSGAAVGALLVGLGRAVFDFWGTSGYPLPVAGEVRFSPTVAEASTVIIMAVVLLIRPSGIFGRKG